MHKLKELPVVLSVHLPTANLPISDRKLTELRRETANDNALIKLAETIQEGWPNYKQNVPRQIDSIWWSNFNGASHRCSSSAAERYPSTNPRRTFVYRGK